jgi:predicted Zn-dependent peptidase
MMSFVACAAIVLGCEPARAPEGVKIGINVPVTRFTLPNGLEVVVQEDHRTPRVAIDVRYHAGAKDDPSGRTGMAHLVEHLQFAESQHVPRDTFFRTMHDLGGEEINGTTDADGTSYFEIVPAASVDAALWIEADRMASARLGWSADAIEREKNVVAQELRLRYKNEPNGFRYQLLTRAVYPEGHPYRRSLDEEKEMRASTADEMREFASHFYGPDDATLMLVGDITVDRAKELVARQFGAIAPCGAVRARPIAPVEVTTLKRLHIAANVAAPEVFVAWALPGPSEDGYYDLPFALRLLEGGVAKFTEEDKKTTRPGSVTWTFDDQRLGSIGYVAATLTPGGKPEDVVDAIEILRARILRFDWAQLGAQRSFSIAHEVRGVEALGDRAREMQRNLDMFGQADYEMTYLRNVQNVSSARSVAATDHFLDPARAAIVIVTPDANAPRSGRVIEEVKR